jgi:AdoMet-dependent rRNA methyltransferase SPB1
MLQMPNVVCLQEDITTERCKIAIKRHIKTFKVDLVLNDGAPNVGQNWSKDAFNQSELTLEALKLATQATSPVYLLLVQMYLH